MTPQVLSTLSLFDGSFAGQRERDTFQWIQAPTTGKMIFMRFLNVQV